MDTRDLFEARRNPDVNTGLRARQVVNDIAPFFGRDDAFISMVDVAKVGIHPSTGHHSTPAAIYAYPLSEPTIWNQFTTSRLPYVSYARHVALLIARHDLVTLSSSSTTEELAPFQETLDRLMAGLMGKSNWTEIKRALHKDAVSRASRRYKSAASIFFEQTRAAAAALAIKNKSPETFGDLDTTDFLNEIDYDSGTSRPLFWNSLLRKLGFDAVIDLGLGYIFSSEPFQAAFLHKGCLANIEIFKNGPSTVYGHGMEITSASHLANVIRSGKMPVWYALDFVSSILDGRDPPANDATSFNVYRRGVRLGRRDVERLVQIMLDMDASAVENRFESWRLAYRVTDHATVRPKNSDMLKDVVAEMLGQELG